MQLLRIVLFFWLVAGVTAPVFARATSFTAAPNSFTPTVMPSESIVSDEKPVVLTADQIDYLQQEDVVVARGRVEVIQGDTLLLADKLVYQRRSGVVNAEGNVSVMDQTGSVIFADEVELIDDMRSGVIEQFKTRLTDDTVFAAARAVKVDDNVLEMDHALYSPCKVKCAEDLAEGEHPKDPLWQLRAKHVRVDQAAQRVVYDDAWMELYGFPVFYTPYLSHATPGADGKSGITVPEFERNDNLGNVYKLPVYYAIGRDRDMIITPIYTSREGPVIRTLYTQRFDSGLMKIDSSLTNPRDRDTLGNLAPGRQVRGHIFAVGDFEPSDDTRWGFDAKRTTDDTYLRKYDIDGSTSLTARVYGETYNFTGSSSRSSLTADGLAFQGLAAGDDQDNIPLALPLVNFDYESDVGAYGSRYFINSNALVISRTIGAQSRRLSNTLGWRLPYITDSGQVIELTSQVRGDIYDVSDVPDGAGGVFNGVTGRVVPEVSALWRYPFINQFSKTNLVLEPVVNLVASPNGGNPDSIPNEDSLVPEFTDTNLFSSNRFAGYDRIEQGARASYGLRGLMNYREAYIDALFGQHYRVQEDSNFPFSNDINDHLSDYVGKVGVQIRPFYLAYRFRMDKETLVQRRKELDMRYTSKPVMFAVSYISLQNDPVFASREEVSGNARVKVAKNWAVGVAGRRDLLIDQLTNIGGEIVFENECMNISNVISREYTRDREVKPNTSYLIRVSLKNLN